MPPFFYRFLGAFLTIDEYEDNHGNTEDNNDTKDNK